MPEKQSSQAQTPNSKWWIPAIIGMMVLFVPGGLYVSPIFFLLSIIMRRKNKPKEKSPETSPHSPLPLINITP